MRHGIRRPTSQSRSSFAAGLLVLAVLLALTCAAPIAWAGVSASAAPAADSATATPLAGDASASPDPSPSTEPTVVSLKLSRSSIAYGDELVAAGTVTPAVAGQTVVIAFDGVDKATAKTDADGSFAVSIEPRRSVAVTACAEDGTLSDAVSVTVRPAVALTHGQVIPFLKLRFVVKIAPSTYDGVVVARVKHRGTLVATVKARARDGRAVVSVPLRGIDWFDVSFTLPAARGLGSRVVTKKVKAEWRTLKVGSKGLRVKGLLTALKRLNIRVPSVGTNFTTPCRDAVVAFQKAHRLPRTYVMGRNDWRKLDGAKPVKPRYAKPATHLEVDKTRQILMVVKGGKVAGLIAVSTGATGNTPEGAFSIRTKLRVSTPLYGSGVMPFTMGFVGQFAIHGYSPVPPYPASHGCVREPLWVCQWVYDQSFIGERLYVYR